MSDPKKKWMGLAGVGTAVAAFIRRLRRLGHRSEEPAAPSDVRR
jgi:hypothetical protein